MSSADILTPFLDDADVILYAGDCIEIMARMPGSSVDAIVTDPPYGLEFMGKSWDSFAPEGDRPKRSGWTTESTGATINREDKSTPAGRAGVAFGKRRKTYKCDDCGKRDAFKNQHGCSGAWEHEWVDALPVQALAFQEFSRAWATEAYRVLKPGGHLLAFAGTRSYHRMASGVEDAGFEIRDCIAWMYGSGFPKSLDVSKAMDKAAGAEREVIGTRTDVATRIYDLGEGDRLPPSIDVTAPATPEAEAWNGWGTALKPAFEPIVVARRPLIGTVAANVLEHGTGALNIDACRIGMSDDDRNKIEKATWVARDLDRKAYGTYGTDGTDQPMATHPAGRWPANVALDATAAEMLDEQSGHQKDGVTYLDNKKHDYNASSYKIIDSRAGRRGYGGEGGASRFFYTAKASRQERNVGGLADNTHPTVKPTDLMRWLIRLVTPPGGIILDPFGGSGSTGLAARAENVRCILIEREPEYLQIIRDRLAQQNLFATRDDHE